MEIAAWESVLVDLLSVPSVTGNEARVAVVLEECLRRIFSDATISRQHVEKDRWNVVMSKGTPQITLTTHIDTVPGGPEVTVTRDMIFGRGACDAKGQVVAQLWGLHNAIRKGLQDYRCVYVVGEETDAVGALKLLDLPITPYLLNGEPTGNKFARRSWGVQEFEVIAEGTSAHSSLGTSDSAIHKLVSDISRLLANQPEEVSLNVGFIRGGVATNVQAPQASCDICARIYGSSEPLTQLLAERLKLTQWRAKFPATEGLELFVPPSLRDSSIEVKFASDCSIYARKYDNVMLFGPGVIQDAHTDDESISREALREASEVISRLLLDIGGLS